VAWAPDNRTSRGVAGGIHRDTHRVARPAAGGRQLAGLATSPGPELVQPDSHCGITVTVKMLDLRVRLVLRVAGLGSRSIRTGSAAEGHGGIPNCRLEPSEEASTPITSTGYQTAAFAVRH